MRDIKEWWLNLALREKKMLALGVIVVALFLVYRILWSPLVNANNNLRTRVLHNQETLNWMRQADQRIQTLLKTSEKSASPTGSLLGIIQTDLHQNALAAEVSQLRQADNDSVAFSFKKIEFDHLIVFLTTLWKKQGLLVSQITVVPGNGPGEVAADVTIKRTA